MKKYTLIFFLAFFYSLLMGTLSSADLSDAEMQRLMEDPEMQKNIESMMSDPAFLEDMYSEILNYSDEDFKNFADMMGLSAEDAAAFRQEIQKEMSAIAKPKTSEPAIVAKKDVIPKDVQSTKDIKKSLLSINESLNNLIKKLNLYIDYNADIPKILETSQRILRFVSTCLREEKHLYLLEESKPTILEIEKKLKKGNDLPEKTMEASKNSVYSKYGIPMNASLDDVNQAYNKIIQNNLSYRENLKKANYNKEDQKRAIEKLEYEKKIIEEDFKKLQDPKQKKIIDEKIRQEIQNVQTMSAGTNATLKEIIAIFNQDIPPFEKGLKDFIEKYLKIDITKGIEKDARDKKIQPYTPKAPANQPLKSISKEDRNRNNNNRYENDSYGSDSYGNDYGSDYDSDRGNYGNDSDKSSEGEKDSSKGSSSGGGGGGTKGTTSKEKEIETPTPTRSASSKTAPDKDDKKEKKEIESKEKETKKVLDIHGLIIETNTILKKYPDIKHKDKKTYLEDLDKKIGLMLEII